MSCVNEYGVLPEAPEPARSVWRGTGLVPLRPPPAAPREKPTPVSDCRALAPTDFSGVPEIREKAAFIPTFAICPDWMLATCEAAYAAVAAPGPRPAVITCWDTIDAPARKLAIMSCVRGC